jgi:hypothetical protein
MLALAGNGQEFTIYLEVGDDRAYGPYGLRHGLEIHTRSGLGRTRPLQPTEEDLGGTRI